MQILSRDRSSEVVAVGPIASEMAAVSNSANVLFLNLCRLGELSENPLQ